MWQMEAGGMRVYRHGREDWEGAAAEASLCATFRADVEEEWVYDDERSCYNCRYRRWTATTFACLASRKDIPQQ